MDLDLMSRNLKWGFAQEMVYKFYTYDEFYSELKEKYEKLVTQVEGKDQRNYIAMMELFEGKDIEELFNSYPKRIKK